MEELDAAPFDNASPNKSGADEVENAVEVNDIVVVIDIANMLVEVSNLAMVLFEGLTSSMELVPAILEAKKIV